MPPIIWRKDNVQNQSLPLSQPCNCGGTSGQFGAGRKPKETSLHCSECQKFIRWVPASEHFQLTGKGGAR
jgi:N-acetyl-gamma-glutamylphosphate reductase